MGNFAAITQFINEGFDTQATQPKPSDCSTQGLGCCRAEYVTSNYTIKFNICTEKTDLENSVPSLGMLAPDFDGCQFKIKHLKIPTSAKHRSAYILSTLDGLAAKVYNIDQVGTFLIESATFPPLPAPYYTETKFLERAVSDFFDDTGGIR